MYGLIKLFNWKENTPSALLENIFEQEINKVEDAVVSCSVPDAWFKIHGISYLKHWCAKNGVEFVEEIDEIAVRAGNTSVVTIDAPIDSNIAKPFGTVTNYVTVGQGMYKIHSIYGAIRAFKGFVKTPSGELMCRDFTYEVGKLYVENYAAPCCCGFHACPKLNDVETYYALRQDVEYHIVELFDVANDDTPFSNEDKIVGRKIRVGQKVPMKTVAKEFGYETNGESNTTFVFPVSIEPGPRFVDRKRRIVFVDAYETMYVRYCGRTMDLYNNLLFIDSMIYAASTAKVRFVCKDETVTLKMNRRGCFEFDVSDKTTEKVFKRIKEIERSIDLVCDIDIEEAAKEAVRAVDNINEDEDEELPF